MTGAASVAPVEEHPAVLVEGLVVSYGSTPVLTGVDLLVPAGTGVCVTGENGIGKSTLLRCVAGLQQADEGDIRVFGGRISEDRRLDPDGQPRRRVRGRLRQRDHHDGVVVVTTVAVSPVRRWIRKTQVAHLDRGERLGTFYFVLLFIVIVLVTVIRQLVERAQQRREA